MSNTQVLFRGPAPRNQALERMPLRALTFLNGLSTHGDQLKRFAAAGYTEKVHQEGWRLLAACGGYGGIDGSAPTTPGGIAIRGLSDWYGTALPRIHAALLHLHPAQEAYVLQGLLPVSGPAAAVAAELLVERLADLAGTGPHAADRAATAADDKKALETLAARGYDEKELKRVAAMVETAHGTGGIDASPAAAVAATRAEALEALKAWYEDWAETARGVFQNRADLIHIGLAKPRKKAAAPPVTGTEPTEPGMPVIVVSPPAPTNTASPNPAPANGAPTTAPTTGGAHA